MRRWKLLQLLFEEKSLKQVGTLGKLRGAVDDRDLLSYYPIGLYLIFTVENSDSLVLVRQRR